ncbi:MAG TPA: PA14 domain-containing protein, partial [Chloroflexota bacterium]|nr:PA14 domain-containing protein [Chloroflexota bacterium]
TLSGQPVLVRDDPEINFNWGTSSPGNGLQNGNFSVRWTRSIVVPGGDYRFLARSNDGVRVWVNGVLLFDEWRSGQNATFQSEITLQPGQVLDVRVEYYHATGLASVHVWAESQAKYPQWRGSYIADPNLQGQPVRIRNDQDINFDWGTGAPAAGMPANNFSVIWIRTLPFNSSGYRFNALVDDGMRLYVDGVLVIDAWQDGTVRQVSGTITLTAGQHDVTVVYYERQDAAQIRVWWEQVNGFE